MAKTKKITVASIMRAAKRDEKNVITVGDDENVIEVPVKNRLTIKERSGMVQDIASMMFAEDEDGNEYYAPYLERFATEYSVMNYFTDIEMPSDMDKIWEFLDSTGVAKKIIGEMHHYITPIISEARELVEHKKQAIIKRSKLDTMFDGIMDVFRLIREKTEGIDEKQIAEYVHENFPEFKDRINKFLKEQVEQTDTE